MSIRHAGCSYGMSGSARIAAAWAPTPGCAERVWSLASIAWSEKERRAPGKVRTQPINGAPQDYLQALGQTGPGAGATSERLYFFPYVDTDVEDWIFFTSMRLTKKYMSLISVPWPDSEPEATMLASLLYAHGIAFFVNDAGLDGILPRMQSAGHERIVLVPEKTADFTIALLSDVMRAEPDWDWSRMTP